MNISTPANAPLDLIYRISSTIPKPIEDRIKRVSRYNDTGVRSKYLKATILTEKLLVEFNGELRSAISNYEMTDHLCDQNAIDVLYYQRVQNCLEKEPKFTEDRFTQFKDREFLFRLFPGFEFYWYKYCQLIWSLIKFVLLVGLSAAVFMGQFHLFFQFKVMAEFIENLVYSEGPSQVYSVLFFVDVYFGYMIIVSCFSLFSIKILGFYGFYYKKTDQLTYLNFIFYMSKLTYPLCYTTLFTLLGNTPNLERTAFYKVPPTHLEHRQPASRPRTRLRPADLSADPLLHLDHPLHVRLLQKDPQNLRLPVLRVQGRPRV
jgi:LMBR1-like membrane protein